MPTNATMRATSWSSVLSFAANDCLTERTQAAITQPEVIKDFLCPLSAPHKSSIYQQRVLATHLVSRPAAAHSKDLEDHSLLIVTGPRFITNHTQSKACAQWIHSKNNQLVPPLADVSEKLKPLHRPVQRLQVMMNVNVSHVKSLNSARTERHPHGLVTVEPYYLTGGLVNTRLHLLELSSSLGGNDGNSGAPLVGHVDDPIAQVYFNDLFTMALVPPVGGSRALIDVASDSDFPVGFHCDANDLKEVQRDYINGCKCSRSHLTIMSLGQVGVVNSKGNDDTFVVMDLNDAINTDTLDELVFRIDRELDHDVKILFDVGKVNGTNYKNRLELVKSVITHTGSLSHRLLGFIIDSGDSYTDDTGVMMNECPVEYNAISQELLGITPKKSSMGNLMMKSLISSYSKLSTLSFKQRENINHNSALEGLIYADKLIGEIDKLVS